MLVECKVQGFRGPGCCTKRSSWGWRWGRNQYSQLCSIAGRRDQDVDLGLTRKISSASHNYLSLELKNFWWTKALLTEHSCRWRNILFLFAFCSLFWWFNRELPYSYNLHFQASIFCPFPKPLWKVPDWFLFWTPWTLSARNHCGIPEDVISICNLGFPPFLLAQISSSSFLSTSLPFPPLFYKISSESISVLIPNHQWKQWISSISVAVWYFPTSLRIISHI